MSGQLVKRCTGCGSEYDYRLRECPACGNAGYSAHRAVAAGEKVRRPSPEQARELRSEETQQTAEARVNKGLVTGAAVGGVLLVLFLIGLALSQGGAPRAPRGAFSEPKVNDLVTSRGPAEGPQGAFGELKWEDLHAGRWPPKGQPRVVPAVAELAGKPVHLRGFLLPLHQAAEASEFFLAAWPGSCPFCFPPSVSDVVVLVTPGGKKMPLTDLPVDVYGILKLATGGPNDDALYVIRDMTFVVSRDSRDGASR